MRSMRASMFFVYNFLYAQSKKPRSKKMQYNHRNPTWFSVELIIHIRYIHKTGQSLYTSVQLTLLFCCFCNTKWFYGIDRLRKAPAIMLTISAHVSENRTWWWNCLHVYLTIHIFYIKCYICIVCCLLRICRI